MQMYVNYFDRYVKTDDELPTIGIVLCGRKNDAVVELTLPEEANIYASKYQLYLPSKQELVAQLESIQRELNYRKAETMNSGQGTMGSALGNGRRALAEEVPVGYKRTEVGVIPEEWKCGRLGDLTTRVGNHPLWRRACFVTGGRPFLRSDVQMWVGEHYLADLAFITDELHASFAASEIEEGDVIAKHHWCINRT